MFFEKEGKTALSWLVHPESFKTDPTIGSQTSCDKKKIQASVRETREAKIRAEYPNLICSFLSANQKQLFLPSVLFVRSQIKPIVIANQATVCDRTGYTPTLKSSKKVRNTRDRNYSTWHTYQIKTTISFSVRRSKLFHLLRTLQKRCIFSTQSELLRA